MAKNKKSSQFVRLTLWLHEQLMEKIRAKSIFFLFPKFSHICWHPELTLSHRIKLIPVWLWRKSTSGQLFLSLLSLSLCHLYTALSYKVITESLRIHVGGLFMYSNDAALHRNQFHPEGTLKFQTSVSLFLNYSYEPRHSKTGPKGAIIFHEQGPSVWRGQNF